MTMNYLKCTYGQGTFDGELGINFKSVPNWMIVPEKSVVITSEEKGEGLVEIIDIVKDTIIKNNYIVGLMDNGDYKISHRSVSVEDIVGLKEIKKNQSLYAILKKHYENLDATMHKR